MQKKDLLESGKETIDVFKRTLLGTGERKRERDGHAGRQAKKQYVSYITTYNY
jgi:hypothetical protein